MVDASFQKRQLPPRDRRESAAKRRATSPSKSHLEQASPLPSVSSSARKKRLSQARQQSPESPPSPAVPVVRDVLPTKIAANQPLPTTRRPQEPSLSLEEYQSIAESAVLATSLHQSRMRWLFDGVFKKYWIKPVKKKGVEIPSDNPDIKSMHKLGAATIIIEPHTFEGVFYTVRDPTALQTPYQRHANQHTPKALISPLPKPAATSMYSPQAGPQKPLAYTQPTNPRPPSTPIPHPPAPHTPQLSLPTPPVQSHGPLHPPPPSLPPPLSNGPRTDPLQTPKSGPNPSQVAVPPAQNIRTPTPGDKSAPPSTSKTGTTDPVIQMLAARASSNPQLKELMKVVATSKASAEQLKEFQSHIDEFNDLIRRQEHERMNQKEEMVVSKAPTATPAPASAPTSTPTPTPTSTFKPSSISQVDGSSDSRLHTPISTPISTSTQLPSPNPQNALGGVTASKPTLPPPRQHPTNAGISALPGVMHTFPRPLPAPSSSPVPPRPVPGYMGYPPPPRPEPVIKHVVLELTSAPSGQQAACQDRWLFPEFAVLEIRPSGLEMVCSFLVERKGSEIAWATSPDTSEGDTRAQDKFQPDKEYYQPVTMTIKVTAHKTIATIAQAAKPLPAVQEYMKEAMSTKERAPVEYLAFQLPCEQGKAQSGDKKVEDGFVDSGVELGDESSEEDELREIYGIQ